MTNWRGLVQLGTGREPQPPRNALVPHIPDWLNASNLNRTVLNLTFTSRMDFLPVSWKKSTLWCSHKELNRCSLCHTYVTRTQTTLSPLPLDRMTWVGGESGQSYLHKSANKAVPRWELGFGALILQPCSHAESYLHWHPKRTSTQGILTTEETTEERLILHRHVKRAWSDYCHFNTINQDDIPSCPSALPLQCGNNNPTTSSLKLKKSGVYLTLI